MTPLSKKSEARRLYDMGFGVHWLRPNSKVPVKSGWSGDNRDIISSLLKEYQTGYNIGTKLGKPSMIGEHYLAVIDVDVKGLEKKHQNAAIEWVRKNFPGIMDKAPITLSGRGNGSMHIWCLVDRPVESRALYSSSEEVEVHMPSAKPTDRQKEILGAKKIKDGFRLRPAFEIDFMCAGRQVVLPPSIHPDTGKQYKWKRPISSASDIPIIDSDILLDAIPASKKSNNGRPQGGTIKSFEITDVDMFDLELRLDPVITSAITDGDDVKDRSAMMLTIAIAMVRADFNDAEILGVLTNRAFYIGDCAYEHAKTTSQQRAARWAYDYCLRKARTEADNRFIFDCEVQVYETLSAEASEAQVKRLVSEPAPKEWRKFLDRTDKGNLKPTLLNVQLIIENVVGKNTFIRDSFSHNDYYGCDTPWGAKKGDKIVDADEVIVKTWFAHTWSIEPAVNIVFECIAKMCHDNGFHPVRDYLETLEWDGVSRIETWLVDYLGAEGNDVYLREISRKFLVAAVARVYEPGKKFDYMIIFEGLQGIGKSTVGNILAGDKWFLDSLPDLTDKDAALNLQGNWICEMGELANLKRTDVEVVKSFISRRVDKVRPPYGKRYIESERQCVFFGTTNSEDYLKDKTGNRRFWPVKVNGLDFDKLKEDRDQLWAEALNHYEMVGENLWLEGEAKDIAEDVQASRVVEDEASLVEHALTDWWEAMRKARKAKAGELGKKLPALKFRVGELFGDFGFGESGSPPLKEFKADNYHLQMASRSLSKIGFRRVTIKGKVYWREEGVFLMNQYS